MSAPEHAPDEGFNRRIERRAAIKWMMTAAASLPLAQLRVRGAPDAAAEASATGYGTDPLLAKTYSPGDFWPLTLTPAQRRTAASLCDTIIPADATSPAASTVGVVDFIDEWISAPYPQQRGDRPIILDGLAWIEEESTTRFAKSFSELDDNQRGKICDDICLVSAARPAHRKAARFFARYRDLTAGGFYTTPVGMKDINYIGNVPLATFDGPSQEIIRLVGLA